MSNRFLVVFDTPSIKQYVFGTDVLREIRGASANLDELNRVKTRSRISSILKNAEICEVYANGGSAQFIIQGVSADEVRQACREVAVLYMNETAGDVIPVYGIAPLLEEQHYRTAVQAAQTELRSRREMTFGHRVCWAMPIATECSSASHLPASGLYQIGGDAPLALSHSSHRKAERGRSAREHGMWFEWMQYLANMGGWPHKDDWDKLRCDTLDEIGDFSEGRVSGYIGLIYADGNAMGQVVRDLPSPDVCRAFSQLVDGSIRSACFHALTESCTQEIEQIRRTGQNARCRLPADILLLGGDDLLVVLPADRSLAFATRVAQEFENITGQKIGQLNGTAKEFFAKLGRMRMSISVGVAIARGNYPFYLLLDLAEELLKNAKKYSRSDSAIEARVDFHVVAGANSFSLHHVRRDDYFCNSSTHSGDSCPRTLRPLSLAQMEKLRDSVDTLRRVNFPRSKLHTLYEASLSPSVTLAMRTIREVFVRCKTVPSQNERLAIWDALQNCCPSGWSFNSETFPFYQRGGERLLAIADIVEAYDLWGK
ncbi:MAG: hypothetical protein KatS3mg110_0256 [Pirellulaceae bacterium]|nr:MAG: hypothetical protein KatS3mg110_0256 [Pirellulaceae bacterium]